MTPAMNPYTRIIKAAAKGVGVRLSAEEVFFLAQDASIVQVASNLEAGIEVDGGGFFVTKEGFIPNYRQITRDPNMERDDGLR